MSPPPPWQVFVPHVFVPYSGFHVFVVAVCALLIAATALFGRALDKNAEAVLRRALAALAISCWLAYFTWWNWHGIDPRIGLPLHICDLNGLIAPFALITGRRWARATLYFWTAALTVQAFIQPALSAGPASLVFWAFWVAHTIIAACAVYDVVVLGFRPDWRDLGRAFSVSLAYLALVVPVNAWFGADYGYVGNPAPDLFVPPFVVALGPWPLRAIILVVLVALGLVVVLLPWRIAARYAAASSPSPLVGEGGEGGREAT
jgi:hypothetical integral membrane protein (TIGR02206 family)